MTLDSLKCFIGDVARPFAIIATSAGASVSMVIIAVKNHDGYAAAAIFIGAVLGGVAALAGAKAWENVKVAQAGGTPGAQP